MRTPARSAPDGPGRSPGEIPTRKEQAIDAICEQCHRRLDPRAGVIRVLVGTVHPFCMPCWERLKPRWFRVLHKQFPLHNTALMLAPYLKYDVPILPSP